MKIRAIPTKYRGVHFRSRLEARIAATLDMTGVAWEYEPEAYQIGSIHYLPDMLIGGTFCEIKPVSPWKNRQGAEKIGALAAAAPDIECYMLYPTDGVIHNSQSLGQVRVLAPDRFASAVLARCPVCGIGQPWTIGDTDCSACGVMCDSDEWWSAHYDRRWELVYPTLPQYQDGRMIWNVKSQQRAAIREGVR